MRSGALGIGLCCVVLLGGCMAGTSSSSTQVPNLTGNWEFLSGSSVPPNAVILSGAIESVGAQVTGTFTGGGACGDPPYVSYSGSVDAAGNLALTSALPARNQLALVVPAGSASAVTGTYAGAGLICNLAFQGPVTGVKIAPLNGSFGGAVTATSTPLPAIANGMMSLVLTQSPTANANGQFDLMGTMTFTGSGCTVTTSLAGTVSGVSVNLASSATPPPNGAYVGLLGSTVAAGNQVSVATVSISPSPCSTGVRSFATYMGTLSL